jgi:SAM-dependent methyltransferase
MKHPNHSPSSGHTGRDPDFTAAIAKLAAARRPPLPWQDATQLPWHDNAFSQRMLQVHLDQSTHMASRTLDVITQHVSWLEQQLDARLPAKSKPFHVLDLGCGPGLYCHELARHGYRVTGCDFAPGPLAYARRTAGAEQLDCRFLTADLAELPAGFVAEVGPVDAITFWFGEFNSFPPPVARDILAKITPCLKPGGIFVVEYQPFELFPRRHSKEWQACESSVFSDDPHLWLKEYYWDEVTEVETQIHWILSAASGELARYGQCHQAYRKGDLVQLFSAVGLVEPSFHPPIADIGEQFEFPLLVTRKQAAGNSF